MHINNRTQFNTSTFTHIAHSTIWWKNSVFSSNSNCIKPLIMKSSLKEAYNMEAQADSSGYSPAKIVGSYPAWGMVVSFFWVSYVVSYI